MKYLRLLIKTKLYILGFLGFYFLATIILMLVPSNPDFEKVPNRNIEIFVVSNGVHVDIVLPFDASNEFENQILNQLNIRQSPQYIAYGWGDKGFYLDTPEWSDLKFSTAFKAVFGLSTSAMHVAIFKNKPIANKTDSFQIFISPDQLKMVKEYIMQSFDTNNGKTRHIDCCWYRKDKTDGFFDAKGTYSLFKTCNVWANGALKYGGVKTATWAPFSHAVMFHRK